MAMNAEYEAKSNTIILEKLHGMHSQHLRKAAAISEDLVVDKRAKDPLWANVKVGFLPIGPKHMLGFEKPSAAKVMRSLQGEWGLSEKAFPAMIFVLKGTSQESWKPEFAMVEPDDFSRSSDDLIAGIQKARESINDRLERSLELVYVATTGQRPPGSDNPPPLLHIPASG